MAANTDSTTSTSGRPSNAPSNDASDIHLNGRHNKTNGYAQTSGDNSIPSPTSRNNFNNLTFLRYGGKTEAGNNSYNNDYKFVSFAFKYTKPVPFRFLFFSNITIDYMEIDTNKAGGSSSSSMNTMPFYVENYNCGNNKCRRNENLTIKELQLKGDTKLEIKLAGDKNTIATLNQDGKSLHLRTNGGSDKLNITTLNQNSTGGDTRIYSQGVTVTTANLKDGTLELSNGTISTLTQSGGNATQNNGTITTLNLKGGTFTHNGGTLTNITLQGGEGNGVFINNTGTAIANITQDGGHHTIDKGSVDGSGKITNFTLKSGSLTNNGTITNLTSGSTTTAQTRSTTPQFRNAATTTANGSTAFYAAQDTRATATRHITNNGTLDSLTLTEPTDVINVLNDDDTPKGIIKALNVQSGESTINTLTGVAQDDKTGISSITIGKNSGGGGGSGSGGSNGAKLTVDTLRVGLNGNTAIQRVTINNDDSKGSQKEFAAKTVQIAYLNGKFDPNTKISTDLKSYVTTNSQNYVDSSSTPVFTISPQARLSGVTGFQPDGTPIFDVEATLAAGMTSLVVRQSMRRKMLLDTYLAEQSRRSIKNKERRTKQRIEAVVLADAKKQYEKDLATYKQDLAKWEKLAATKENKALIAKYEQEDKAYQKALEQYEKDKAKYDKDKAKWDKANGKLAPIAPVAPKEPTKPNLKPTDKNYKQVMADFDKAQKEHKKALAQYQKDLKQYEKDKAKYDKDKAKWDTANGKLAPAPIAPVAPKEPTKPNLKPNHKDYKKAMAAYTKAQQEHKTALAQYEKDLAKYKLDKEKWDKESQKLVKSGKIAPVAPTEPKAPAIPAILASKPIAPIEPSLHNSTLDLYADAYGVSGDFFLRPYGGIGDHKTADGAQTSSWSVGTLLGANWDLKLGNSQGNIGFYGGYEYLHNGYKQAGINAQGHTGFLGLRFSHLFAKTKLAGFYYIADINGGWTEVLLDQNMGLNAGEEARFRANVGNINFGSSLRLGSSIYMAGAKSMLFPSLGVGVEGGYLGDFTMRTQRTEDMYYGGLSQGYAVSYAQANLNYYQEYGKRLSTTLGGGFRYLMNNEVKITPTLNGKAYAIDKDTGSAAHIKLAPFFYQGTFMVNYHTDNAGNFSVGYVAVGGLLGITHNASMRWHYFF